MSKTNHKRQQTALRPAQAAQAKAESIAESPAEPSPAPTPAPDQAAAASTTDAERHSRHRHAGSESKRQSSLRILFLSVSIFTICAVVIKVLFFWHDIGALWHQVWSVLSPYLTGCFIAYLLNPFVLLIDKWFLEQKCHIPNATFRRGVALVVTYIVAVGLVAQIMVFLVPQLYTSVMDIVVNKIPEAYTSGVRILENFFEKYDFLPNKEVITQTIEEKAAKFTNVEYLSSLVTRFFPSVWSTSMSIVKYCLNLVIALVVSIYLLTDKNIVAKASRRLLFAFVRKEKAYSFLDTLSHCNNIFGGFIWGKTVDSLIIGVITLLVLTILQIPYALLIAVVVGVTNMIPYFGPYVGAIPGAVILLMVAPNKVIPYLIAILVIQQFDGWVLGPKILGDFTGLRPVLILFAISVGGAVAGVAGMFLGVPVIAVIQYLVHVWVDKRLMRRGIQPDSIEPANRKITLKDVFFKV